MALAAAGLAIALLARPAATQSKAFTFVRITDDLYHAVGTGAMTVGCNGAVIINDNDVLVVDSHISPPAAAVLRDELKTITPKPIRFVVNTHFHFDHAHGNEIYGPDVEIIGHEFTRAQLTSGASKSGRSYASFVGTLPAQIAQMKARAASADGGERSTLETQIGIMERHYRASEAVTPTPPTITLRETMTLHRGGREIRLLFLGRGHTGGDVIVHLPKERAIATGDLLTQNPSYLGDGYFTEWIATLEKLKTVDFDIVLPGHGDAFNGKAKMAKLNDEGVKVDRGPRREKPALEVPEDLTKALKKNKKAFTAFEAFPPSHKREYVEWIVEAKGKDTRKRRLETAVEWMAEGKPRNWKYVR